MARGLSTRPGGACARAVLGAALAACMLAAPATAKLGLPATVDAFDIVFQDWMRRHRVARGVLAVSNGDRLALARGYGGLDPGTPLPLASLAKPITGACVATLVRDGRLSLGTRLGDALGPFFRRHGEPADARVRAITVEQLLTHRSGFSRKANPDPASGVALAAHLREFGGARPHLEEALARALRYRLARAPGTAYEYVNVNYLILGAVIEQASGRPYEDYCRTSLLRPLGIAGGRLGPKWAALSAYGGWSLSGPEYLAFLRAFDRASGMLDATTQRWMLSPAGKRIDGEHIYSLGVVMRHDAAGPSLWHTGLWTHAQNDVPGGPLADSHATLAVKSAEGPRWFVYMAPQPSTAARAELDQALWRAARAVKRWPAENLFARYGVGREQRIAPASAPLKTGDASVSGTPARN